MCRDVVKCVLCIIYNGREPSSVLCIMCAPFVIGSSREGAVVSTRMALHLLCLVLRFPSESDGLIS
jgi:hypothetical protein